MSEETGLTDDTQRELDEVLSGEDITAIYTLPDMPKDSPEYVDGPDGNWEDDEDEVVEDDSDDDPDADFSGDELLTEAVDYGEAEEVEE